MRWPSPIQRVDRPWLIYLPSVPTNRVGFAYLPPGSSRRARGGSCAISGRWYCQNLRPQRGEGRDGFRDVFGDVQLLMFLKSGGDTSWGNGSWNPIIYRGFIHPRWLFGISEPSNRIIQAINCGSWKLVRVWRTKTRCAMTSWGFFQPSEQWPKACVFFCCYYRGDKTTQLKYRN